MKNLTQKTLLASAVALMLSPAAYAATDAEVAALRAEVAELRALIQAQAPQAAPTGAAPTFVSQDSAVRQFGGQTTALTQPQGLKITSSNGTEVELYGVVRVDGSYVLEGNDGFSNNIANVGAPVSTSNPAGTAVEDKFLATAKNTRLGFNFKSNLGDNKISAKVETDFFDGQGGNLNNGNGALRVRHAFMTYNDWLIGQTKSNFLGYSPELLDSGTNMGTGFARTPMVRYSKTLQPGTQLLVGLERGQTASANTTTQYQMPALTARLNQNFHGKDGLMSVRAMVERYNNVQAGKKSSATGWGMGIGANYKVNPTVELFADISHTKGTSGLITGTSNGYAINAATGDLEQNAATAWMAGVALKPAEKLRANIGYGQVSFDDGSAYANLVRTGTTAASNEKLQSAWANIIYSPVNQVDFGLEYHKGTRQVFSGEKYDDDRIGMMAAYKF